MLNQPKKMCLTNPSQLDNDNLSHEEVQALEEDLCIIKSATRQGKRKVSGALLSPPDSDCFSSSSSSSPAVSIRHSSLRASADITFELPISSISSAALEFIGFNSETAEKIYARWLSRPTPNNNPDDLLNYVYGHILMLHLESFRNYTPREALGVVGLASWLQDAILDTKHSAIFATETLSYWLKDTLKINYHTLDHLLIRLKRYGVRSVARRNKFKRGKIEGAFHPTVATPAEEDDSSRPYATLNVEPGSFGLPRTWVAVQEAEPVPRDHCILYKGIAALNTDYMEWVRHDGSISMKALATYRGGDFNFSDDAWYWTPELETAEQYRSFAERRCCYTDTWIISIHVPKTFLDTLRIRELWYSFDWKEYVWNCRKGMDPPERYHIYFSNEVDLMKGHICSSHSNQVTRIKKENVQDSLSGAHLMNESQKATQWVFMNKETAERLGREIRGKTHIDVTAAGGKLEIDETMVSR